MGKLIPLAKQSLAHAGEARAAAGMVVGGIRGRISARLTECAALAIRRASSDGLEQTVIHHRNFIETRFFGPMGNVRSYYSEAEKETMVREVYALTAKQLKQAGYRVSFEKDENLMHGLRISWGSK